MIQKKKNTKIYINKTNHGAGGARNYGIKRSRGEFLAFLDSDDIWKKNKLKKQIEFMKKKKIFASHTSYKIIDENNINIGSRNTSFLIKFDNLKFSCDIGLSTVVLRKKKNMKYEFANLKTKEDYVMWLNLTKNNINFYFVPNFNKSKFHKYFGALLRIFWQIKVFFIIYHLRGECFL